MALPPELLTDRLRLRGTRAGDFAACAALWGDPAAVLAWADRELPQPQTCCLIDPGNAASERLLL